MVDSTVEEVHSKVYGAVVGNGLWRVRPNQEAKDLVVKTVLEKSHRR